MRSREISSTKAARLTAAVAALVVFVAACSDADTSDSSTTLAAPQVTTKAPAETATPAPTSEAPPMSTLPIDTNDPDAITVMPGDDLATLVERSLEGSTFILETGTHRLQSVTPKNGMTFVGQPGTVMNGSIVLDGFESGDRYWRFDGIEMTGFVHGRCIDGYEGCAFSQDLFMDDQMLWQVTELDQLDEGKWFWEGNTIYVADDPSNRIIELSVAEHAFVGSADDVTISDLKIEKYATPAQRGTIQAETLGDDGVRGWRWVIENVEVTGSHGAGIRTGDFTRVIGAYLHHNGQLGLSVSGGTGVVIEDSELAFNNIAGFSWGWEGGGMKAVRTNGLMVRNNRSHDNNGPGLWTDIDNVATVYENNRVVDNLAMGIFHEISGDAVIRYNTVERNGFGSADWLWGAGILVAASRDVEVYENRVFDNADGIAGIQQERGEGPDGPRLLQNLSVYNNTVRTELGQTGVVEDIGSSAVFTERNLVFTANTYVDALGDRFAWGGQSLDREGWLAVGQDTGAVWQ